MDLGQLRTFVITPNFITTTGFVLNVVAAGMFVYAGIYGGQNDQMCIRDRCIAGSDI